MYKYTTTGSVVRTADNAYIPNDPENSDYRKFLLWLSSGNTPAQAETDLERLTRLADYARCTRDRLLRESDSMVLPDFPGGSSPSILAYRQALRDWPANNMTLSEIENPVWPTIQ